jgi:hypothetical protein
MKTLAMICASTVLFALATVARSAVIDTLPLVSSSTFSAGSPIGQTFIAPATADHDFLSLKVFAATTDPAARLRVSILEWNDTLQRPTGSALFVSGPAAIGLDPNVDEVLFAAPSPVELVPGGKYVFLFDEPALNNPSLLKFRRSEGGYADGVVYQYAGSDASPWFQWPGDFAFVATLVEVPEPASLGIVGVMGVAMLVRRSGASRRPS